MFDFSEYRGADLTNFIKNEVALWGVTAEITDEKGNVEIPSFYTEAVGFDTESTTIFDDAGNVTACYCYSYQIALGRKAYAIYRTDDEFFEVLHALKTVADDLNRAYDSRVKLLIWVANLAHEFAFIKYRLFDEFNVERSFAKSHRDVLVIDCGAFEFRECLGLFGHSLADVARNWTETQKASGDLDYNLVRVSSPDYSTPLTAKERGYCINDVVILAEMHAAIVQAYTQSNGALVIPYTSAGFVRLKLKQYIMNDDKLTDERLNNQRYFHKNKPLKRNIFLVKKKNRSLYVDAVQWSLCRYYGYSGGLCGSNIDYVGKTLKNVECVDLTSDYPAQFAHNYYPCGNLKKVNPKKYPELYAAGKRNERSYFVVLQIDEIRSKTYHATLSKHKILNFDAKFSEEYGEPREAVIYNGKVRRARNIVVIWNEVDVDAYEKIYDIKNARPLVVWAFTDRKPLPDWWLNAMIDDYEKKAVLKKAGKQNSVEYRDAKRNVNTFYGVAATKSGETFDEFLDGLFVPSEEFSFEKMKYNTWLNPYYAFWCTSYARRILMNFISRFPELIVQYDTDSLYYRKDADAGRVKELQNAIHEYNAIVEKKNRRLFAENPNIELLADLGTWDFDSTYSEFLPLGAKKYIKRDDSGNVSTVIAGLPKNAIPAKIVAEGITKPFDYFNPLKRWIDDDYADICIEHIFAHKFASEYGDEKNVKYIDVTDYLGITTRQKVGSYHAIKPIDFTLSMGVEYLKHIVGGK